MLGHITSLATIYIVHIGCDLLTCSACDSTALHVYLHVEVACTVGVGVAKHC